MKIQQILTSAGLSDKQSQVYLALLQLGTATALLIAKKAEIKRPTTYIVLDELVELGLVSIMRTQNTTHYTAVNPRRILNDIRRKERIVNDALPELLALYKDNTDKPSIEVFEGENGMKNIYMDIIATLKRGKEVCFFGFPYNSSFYNDILESWMKETKSKRHKVREILPESDDKRLSKYIAMRKKNKNQQFQTKILSKNYGAVLNDNAIVENKLILFSTSQNPYALVIQNKDIANSYRAIFEVLWEKAQAL